MGKSTAQESMERGEEKIVFFFFVSYPVDR